MLRFTTAGESHGQALVAILEGIPAGLALLADHVNEQLARRQQGYGRGRRMQIEHDTVELLSGVRAGETIGSPIGMLVRNRDWKNWQDIMDPAPTPTLAAGADAGAKAPRRRVVTRVRPGHADLTGLLKYDREDARDILERASARETTARVALGAVCRRLLAEFGVRVGSHVVQLGDIRARRPDQMPDDLNAAADQSVLRTLDRDAEQRMIARIDAVKRDGNTLGGVCEIVATGACVGLGSHTAWDRRLDARIGRAMLSIPAVKGVEIGMGFGAAGATGAEVHDEMAPAPENVLGGGVRRGTNRAGGLEGGMTTGEPLIVRAAMKPISTLMKPLATVDMATGEPAQATAERSDVTAVPAMGVIAEAMLALVLAEAMLEKFGGDSLREMRYNYDGYLSHLKNRLGARSR
ncbi:MAG: chorismate synthase [Gemmatimonadaceae bacterium]